MSSRLCHCRGYCYRCTESGDESSTTPPTHFSLVLHAAATARGVFCDGNRRKLPTTTIPRFFVLLFVFLQDLPGATHSSSTWISASKRSVFGCLQPRISFVVTCVIRSMLQRARVISLGAGTSPRSISDTTYRDQYLCRSNCRTRKHPI